MSETKRWVRPFFTIYIGQAFSLIGSSAVQFSILWWITLETGSAMALTLASVAGLLPQAVIGPFAGVWVDRFNRKWVMILADWVSAVASLLLFVTFFFGTPTVWFIYLVLFLRALGETFHKPALSAAVPQLVPAGELTRAGGLGQVVSSLCTIAGPMLGALMMSVTSLQYAMLVDVAGAILAVGTLALIRLPSPTRKEADKNNVLADMKLGFAEFRRNKPLRAVFLPVFLATLVFVPLGTLFPLMIREFFHGTAWHNGMVQTVFSMGMLLGAGIIGVTGGLKKQFRMISFAIMALGVCSLLSGFLTGDMFWLFCALVLLMGVSGMSFNIPFVSYVQRTVPQEHMGKVLSIITSILSYAAPVGMFVAGPVSEQISVGKWMVVAGVLTISIGILCFLRTNRYDRSASTGVQNSAISTGEFIP